VLARDHVLITRFSRVLFIFSTFAIRWSATNGPFLRLTTHYLALRLRTIIFVVRLLRRVFLPIVI
jgi:hypothetical protein